MAGKRLEKVPEGTSFFPPAVLHLGLLRFLSEASGAYGVGLRGASPSQSWGPVGKDSVLGLLLTLSPGAHFVVPGSADNRHVKGIRLTVHVPFEPSKPPRLSPWGQREARLARAGRWF